MTLASSLTEKRSVWRWEGIALAVLFGFGVVLWPFLSFGAIFIFDSPIQNRTDEVQRAAVAYFIWYYPITYLATGLTYYLLRRCGVWRLVSCFAWGLPIVIYFVLPVAMGWRGAQNSNLKRVQLLFRTDHVSLLAACREVMIHRNTLKHRSEDASRSFVDPSDPRLPPAIATLRPRSIVAEDDTVFLELHGGFDRCGVEAYSERTAGSHTNGLSGEFLLTQGLWFYDQELTYQRTDRAEYLKKLRAMKPDNAPAPKW